MAYLNAIIKETMRRHPPSHFLFSHAARRCRLKRLHYPKRHKSRDLHGEDHPGSSPLTQLGGIPARKILTWGEGYDVDLMGNRDQDAAFWGGTADLPSLELGYVACRVVAC